MGGLAITGNPYRKKVNVGWNKGAAIHIGKHGDLTIEQIKEAINGKYVMFNVGGNKVKILCEWHGRILCVIARRVPNQIFLVTAYNANDKDKKLYRKRAQW